MFCSKSGPRCACFVASIALVFVMLCQSGSTFAQQPWKAAKKANARIDRAIRNAQQAEYRYSKRVYQQQQKLYRQNEKAAKQYYRNVGPTTILVPVETVPFQAVPVQTVPVYGSAIITAPVVESSQPITYSTTWSETVYQQPAIISSAPVVTTPTHVVDNGWQTVASPAVVHAPATQVSNGEMVYSEPANSQVIYESPYPPSETATATAPFVQSSSEYTVVESTVVPASPVATESTLEGEPTLAPIPDPEASVTEPTPELDLDFDSSAE